MLRVALRGIRAHLVRFILSLLAVALGVAFVAGTFALRSMMSGTFDAIVDASTTADTYVRGLDPDADSANAGAVDPAAGFGAARPTVNVDLIPELEALDGVETVLPEVQGSIVLVGADGTAVQSGQAPSFAMLYSADDPAINLVAGRAPEGAGEIVLETAALESAGFEVGDSTTIVLAGEIREVTIVGQMDFAAAAGATIVVIPQDVGMAAFAPEGEVTQLAVYGQDGVSEADLAATISDHLEGNPAIEALTGDAVRTEAKEAIASVLGFVATFLLVFAAIALFVGAFIISNTFAMSVRQRMREFALLRAVGASPAQVFSSILIQAAVVGLIGSALGVLGGLGLVEVLRSVMAGMGMELSGEIPVDAPTIIISLVVGTVVSVVAAAIPARRAALVPPVEAMRDEVSATDASLKTRTIIGLAILAIGGAALAAALIEPEADSAESLLGVGAAGIAVAMLVLAPSLARLAIGVLAWPFVRTLSPMGKLARGNLVRHPRRTASTASALMIGMALVGAASVIAATTQASVATVVADEVEADLVLRSATMQIPAGAVDDVAALDEVAVADAMTFAPLTVTPQEGEAAPAAIVVGVPEGTFGRTMNVETVAGDLATLADGDVVVNEMTAGKDKYEVGDVLTISGATGPVEFTVGAIISSQGMGGSFVVSDTMLDTLAPPQAQMIDTVFVQGSGDDLEALKAAVAEAVSPYIVVSVMTSEEFVSNLSAQIDQILVILYALLGLSIVIAVLGIVNTLALSVIERTREIGLLRAVGLGRLQLAGTVTIESVLTSVFGTVVGLAVGVGLAATQPRIFAEEGLSTLAIPWGSLLGMLALAIVVGVLAALWPGVRAARLRVLDAVSYE
mgnify:FL=1